jgi:hypothetical protein
MAERRTPGKAEPRDRDRLDKRPAQPRPPTMTAAAGAVMPAHEPEAAALGAQRQTLLGQVEELEAQVRFMGAAHPQRQALLDRLARVRELLQQIDDALAHGQG